MIKGEVHKIIIILINFYTPNNITECQNARTPSNIELGLHHTHIDTHTHIIIMVEFNNRI